MWWERLEIIMDVPLIMQELLCCYTTKPPMRGGIPCARYCEYRCSEFVTNLLVVAAEMYEVFFHSSSRKDFCCFLRRYNIMKTKRSSRLAAAAVYWSRCDSMIYHFVEGSFPSSFTFYFDGLWTCSRCVCDVLVANLSQAHHWPRVGYTTATVPCYAILLYIVQ